MDPISLAASLVTLIGLAAKSYEQVYNFQMRLRDAPADIKRLVADVKTLEVLLRQLHRSIEEVDSADIPSDLLALRIEKTKEFKDDLDSFHTFVEKLREALDRQSLGKLYTWARVKRLLSEERLQSFQRKFADHIRLTGYFESQLQGYSQPFSALTSMIDQPQSYPPIHEKRDIQCNHSCTRLHPKK